MTIMDSFWKTHATAHAQEEFPREACGLVIEVNGAHQYFRCRNLARNQVDFIMDPQDYQKAEDSGQVVAIFHSHPNARPEPSQADRVGCEASGLPWHIISLPSQLWALLQPEGYRAPLIGREYACGILDCYSLVRDWYREKRGVELLDFERTEDSFRNGDSLYMDNFRKTGFEPIPQGAPLEAGDVILMQIRAPVPNHGAIYLGNDVMLHHLMNRLSSREIFGGWYRKVTRAIIRFKGMPT